MKKFFNDAVAAARSLGGTGVPPVPAGVPPGGSRSALIHQFVNAIRPVSDSAGRRAEQAGRLCYPSWCGAPTVGRSLLITCALLALMPFAAGQATRTKKEKGGKNGPVAATPTPVPLTGYGLFRMVRLKNIFDPDRRPMPTEGAAKPAPTLTPGNRNSYLTLTGTMVTESKRLAFFSGSHSEYNRVVKAHDKVGDLEVETISTSHVDLKRGDENIVLAVGKQVTLGDKSAGANAAVMQTPATAAETLGAAAVSVSSSAAPDSVPSATPAPAIGDPFDPNDIKRKMMERRLKESK